MKRFFKIFSVGTIAAVLSVMIFGLYSPLAHADSSSVKVRPAIIEDVLTPGRTFSSTIQITNLNDKPQTYYFQKSDISGMNDQGQPILAGSQSSASQPSASYELASWIQLPADTVTLAANQTKDFPFQIVTPIGASPGGHFAVVFVSTAPPKIDTTGSSLGYEVGTILSMQIAGQANDNAMLYEFRTDKVIYGSPNVTFTTRVQNNGNTLVRPIGSIQIIDMFGKTDATIDVNDSNAGIFPNTIRDFTNTWQGSSLSFGKYKVLISLAYGPDGDRNTISSTLSFWVLPVKILVPAILIILLLVSIIVISVRVYVNRQLQPVRTSQGRSAARTSAELAPPSYGKIIARVLWITVGIVILIFLVILVFS